MCRRRTPGWASCPSGLHDELWSETLLATSATGDDQVEEDGEVGQSAEQHAETDSTQQPIARWREEFRRAVQQPQEATEEIT